MRKGGRERGKKGGRERGRNRRERGRERQTETVDWRERGVGRWERE